VKNVVLPVPTTVIACLASIVGALIRTTVDPFLNESTPTLCSPMSGVDAHLGLRLMLALSVAKDAIGVVTVAMVKHVLECTRTIAARLTLKHKMCAEKDQIDRRWGSD